MKHILMGIVGALMLTTSAQAYYSAGVMVEDSSCTVDTNLYQDAWWHEKLAIDPHGYNAALTYHTARTNGNNFSAAAICWVNEVVDNGVTSLDITMTASEFSSFMQNVYHRDEDDVTVELEQAIGFVPEAMFTADDLGVLWVYASYDLSNLGFVAVPTGFLDALNDADANEVAAFQHGWQVANGLIPGYSAYSGTLYLTKWVSNWTALSEAADYPTQAEIDALNTYDAGWISENSFTSIASLVEDAGYEAMKFNFNGSAEQIAYINNNGMWVIYNPSLSGSSTLPADNVIDMAASISEYFY